MQGFFCVAVRSSGDGVSLGPQGAFVLTPFSLLTLLTLNAWIREYFRVLISNSRLTHIFSSLLLRSHKHTHTHTHKITPIESQTKCEGKAMNSGLRVERG